MSVKDVYCNHTGLCTGIYESQGKSCLFWFFVMSLLDPYNGTNRPILYSIEYSLKSVIKRPGVAGAVLQTTWSLTHSLRDSVILCENIFKTLSLPSRKSFGPEILREFSPPPMCHMSHFMCYVSYVTYQIFCLPSCGASR